jgi:hypothetical protein
VPAGGAAATGVTADATSIVAIAKQSARRFCTDDAGIFNVLRALGTPTSEANASLLPLRR